VKDGGKIALWVLGAGAVLLLTGGTVEALSKYGFDDLLALAQSAGFAGDNASVAAAIALAESSGNPKAEGDRDKDGNPTSLGLWQIHFTVHPEFDKDRLFDPSYNASAAFHIFSKRGGFTDWTTFTHDTYLAYLPKTSGEESA
jgi:hypothetical protein